MKGTDPLVVAELRRLFADNGGALTPEAIVEAARAEESALHDKFDWDDSEAAHAWRIHQARNLLRVVVTYIGPAEDQICTRVFVSLTTDRTKGGDGYREIEAVMSNQEYRDQLLADALEEMRRFEQKYSALKELAGVFSAMRKAVSRRKAT